jgi:pilus assembly protein CpaC
MNKFTPLIIGATATITLLAVNTSAQQVPARGGALVGAPAPAIVNTAPTQDRSDWVTSDGSELVRVPLDKVVSLRLPGAVRNVIIGNPDVADIILPEDGSQMHAYIVARAVGATSIVLEDIDGNVLFQGDVQVDADIAGIRAALKETLPDEKITVSSHRNSVFLKGFVRSAVASNTAVSVARNFVTLPIEVVNNLEVLGSQQVVMQVRVAEIKRSTLKGLGVDLGIGDTVGFSGSTNTSLFLGEIGQTHFGSAVSTISQIPGLTSVTIRALEDQGFAKTLAEPTLTAVSGETASFLAGGSFPMPTDYDSVANTVTFAQTPFGVALNFTPIVLNKGRISLRVKTTVSDRDDTVAVTTTFGTIPGLTEKTTETTVELPSGGSLLMSGLIQTDMLNYVEGIPGLKDIPILGALFRSEGFKNEETELVVLITAYLARPTSNSQVLAMPTDGFSPAGDLDFFLLGRLHKLYALEELPPYATPLVGPYGYIME